MDSGISPVPVAGLDSARIQAALGGTDLAWLIERCRTRIERGKPLTGVVSRANANPAERAAIGRLLGRAAGQGSTLSLRLELLDEEITESGIAPDLRAAVEVLTGPLRDLPAEQSGEQARIDAALAALHTGPHTGSDWYQNWIRSLVADGTLTRLSRRSDLHLAGHAAAVLGRLPSEGLLPLPVLAERAVGDTKALAATPLARLVLRALAGWHGESVPRGRPAERELWLRAGVVADDLSSQVLVLNLRCQEDHVVADWLRDAADFAIPFRITLHQLTQDVLTPIGPELYVCENPAVLRMAAAQPQAQGVALICTEGVPSAACLRLLQTAVRAGVQLHWHADLDWSGLRMTGDAITRLDALPWRMTVADYLAGLERGESEPLRGSPAESPWDPELATELARHQRAVMEERVLTELLADLAGGAPGTKR
jgi:uncharacterized protein (TIGR02679 family)